MTFMAGVPGPGKLIVHCVLLTVLNRLSSVGYHGVCLVFS